MIENIISVVLWAGLIGTIIIYLKPTEEEKEYYHFEELIEEERGI